MKHLLVFIVSISLVSCSNDDNDPEDNASPITGKWNLVNIVGGFEGINQDFEKGTIQWDFNEATAMVTIINNSDADMGVNSGLASGTYPYVLSAPADREELIVNDSSLGRYTNQGNTFVVQEQFRDGFTITFMR